VLGGGGEPIRGNRSFRMNSSSFSTRFSACSARCSAVARAASTRTRRASTRAQLSVFDFGAGVDVVAFDLVEFALFAVGGELGSNGCVRFKGRRWELVALSFDPSSLTSSSNSNELPFELFWTCFLRFIVLRLVWCCGPLRTAIAQQPI